LESSQNPIHDCDVVYDHASVDGSLGENARSLFLRGIVSNMDEPLRNQIWTSVVDVYGDEDHDDAHHGVGYDANGDYDYGDHDEANDEDGGHGGHDDVGSHGDCEHVDDDATLY